MTTSPFRNASTTSHASSRPTSPEVHTRHIVAQPDTATTLVPTIRLTAFESTAATTRISSAELALIGQLYQLRDRASVTQFLYGHHALSSLLIELAVVASVYLPQAALELGVVTDPEEGGRELVLFLVTSQDPAEALAQLDRFDEEWWLDNRGRGRGEISVSLDYR